MENDSQGKKIVSQKLKGMVKMEKMSKAEKMSLAINEFILSNDFLTRYIVDGVKEKIYIEREYYPDMINEVIENDLTAGYNGGYIADLVFNELSIYPLADKIHDMHKEDFMEIANQCNTRNW